MSKYVQRRQRLAGQRQLRQPRAVALVQRLAGLGVMTDLRRWVGGYTASGITAEVDMRAVTADTKRLPHDVAIVSAALRAGIPATVAVKDPERQSSSSQTESFREQCCRLLAQTAVNRRLLGLSVAAEQFPDPSSRAAFRSRHGAGGDGPRYLQLSTAGSAVQRAELESVWSSWRQGAFAEPQYWPVHYAGVRSRCPLLPAESSTTLLPGSGIAAPANTAWLSLYFNILKVADDHGVVDYTALNKVLDACIDLGDRLFDELTWFNPGQRLDARRNRRLAVVVSGFGDLVVRRAEDPSDWQCLQRVDRLVARLHRELWRRSEYLAQQRGPLPALLEREPKWSWCDDAHAARFRERWHAALNAQQVRHRNLLVLSPYAVLPQQGATIEYADLLPALGHADAFCFAAAPTLSHWSLDDFQAFHRRLKALIAHHNAASFVAARA